jgi:hypothetical protein
MPHLILSIFKRPRALCKYWYILQPSNVEERVSALRRYRQQQESRRGRETGSGGDSGAAGYTEEDDRPVRRRLRTLLGVRTRRAGHDGQNAQRSGDAADDAAGAR